MEARLALASLVIVFAAVNPLLAATWHVPDQIETIGEALGLAGAGDSVVVAPGTYHEYDLLVASGVTLRGSTGDPADVVVDAGQLGGVMSVPAGATDVVIEGLTLTNGLASGRGGALVCGADAHVTVTHCEFAANASNQGGGAVALESSDAVFRHCGFTENTTPGNGGAVRSDDSSPLFADCTFTSGQSGGNGSAVAVQFGEATFDDCSMSGNHSQGYSLGAITARQATVILNRCQLSGNLAWTGGAVAGEVSAIVSLRDCVIAGNEGLSGVGGGVAVVFNSDLEAYDTVFAGNVVDDGYVHSQSHAFLFCCESLPELWTGDGFVLFDDEDCAVAVRSTTLSGVKELFR